MKFHDLVRTGVINKLAFDEVEGPLRTELIRLQRQLESADFPLIIVLEGDDRMGVNQALGKLHEWLDVRRITLNVYDTPEDQARQRPYFWRFWRGVPARGRIGIYMNAWATRCATARLTDSIGKRHLERRLTSARDFETQLVDDGALVLKFWIHLDRKTSKRKLESKKDDAESFWRLEDEDRYILEHYARAMKVSRQVVDATQTPEPWLVLDGACERFRDLTIGETIRDRLRLRLAAEAPARAAAEAAAVGRRLPGEARLAALPAGRIMDEDEYDRRREAAQRELARLVHKMRAKDRSMVLVFEGPDAAGKGGSIRRVASALDARDYRAHSIAAPTDEEKARPYLWRFWRRLPGAGKIAIFDRSWYGRLLVERVESFAVESDWRRAFTEIPDFERQLVDHGTVVLKFWLHIDPDEQMRRFAEREETSWKQHKITEDDYRNRRRWDDYIIAAEDMFAATERPGAPWLLVNANDKRSARVAVLEGICEHLGRSLARGTPSR